MPQANDFIGPQLTHRLVRLPCELPDSLLDNQMQNDIEYLLGGDGTIEGTEKEHPEPLRLDEDDMWRAMDKHTDWGKGFDYIAKDYVETFSSYVLDNTTAGDGGLDLALRHVDRHTNEVSAWCSIAALKLLYVTSLVSGHKLVCEEAACGIDDLCEDFDRWSEMDLGYLITAVVPMFGLDLRYEKDLQSAVLMEVYQSETEQCAWQETLDWAKFQETRAAMRHDKWVALCHDEPDHPLVVRRQYELAYPRCDKTLDLFENAKLAA